MPFQITLWSPADNQKIYQTQKSIYTLHLIHSSIYISEIMWTPSIGHHGPPVEKPCIRSYGPPLKAAFSKWPEQS